MSSFLQDFINTVFVDAKSVLTWSSSIQIIQQDENVLVLQSRRRQFVFNKRFRTVKSGARVLAQFDAIDTVDLIHHSARDDEPDNWSVRLNVQGWLSTVVIGKTRDDVEASMAAARISTFTGKNVRTL
ncbi:MAG: hypothetical protein V4805_07075 [Pseudomonadota bacterium]